AAAVRGAHGEDARGEGPGDGQRKPGEAVRQRPAAPRVAAAVGVALAAPGGVRDADLAGPGPERAVGRSGAGAAHELAGRSAAGRQLVERGRAGGGERRRGVLAVAASLVGAAQPPADDLRGPRDGGAEPGPEWRGRPGGP